MVPIEPYILEMQKVRDAGGVLSTEAEDLVKLYEYAKKWQEIDWLGYDARGDARSFSIGDFIELGRELFGSEFEIPTVTPGETDMGAGVAGEGASGGWGIFTEMSNALANFPDAIVVESHVYVDGYELGKATEEATITYDKSTGQ
jgi:hypothetical protein